MIQLRIIRQAHDVSRFEPFRFVDCGMNANCQRDVNRGVLSKIRERFGYDI